MCCNTATGIFFNLLPLYSKLLVNICQVKPAHTEGVLSSPQASVHHQQNILMMDSNLRWCSVHPCTHIILKMPSAQCCTGTCYLLILVKWQKYIPLTAPSPCNRYRCSWVGICFVFLGRCKFLYKYNNTYIYTVQVHLKPIWKQHAMLCLYLVLGKWSVTCVIRSEMTLVDNKVNGGVDQVECLHWLVG